MRCTYCQAARRRLHRCVICRKRLCGCCSCVSRGGPVCSYPGDAGCHRTLLAHVQAARTIDGPTQRTEDAS